MKSLRRLVTVASAVALVAVVAACSSGPAATKLSDPKDIVTKAATSAQNAKAIHATLALSGTVNFDPSMFSGMAGGDTTGSGTPTAFDLKGTTAEMWVDVAAKNARITISATPLMNTTADMIVIGKDSYIKLTGPLASMMGDSAGKYIKSTSTDETATSDLTDPTKTTDEINAALTKPGVNPTLVGVEKVNGRDSYHLKVNVPQEDLSQGADMGVTLTNVTADMWAAVDNQQITKVEIKASGDKVGSVTLTMDLDYPSSVSIKAPPDSEVVTQ